jgi:hypothetical protein
MHISKRIIIIFYPTYYLFLKERDPARVRGAVRESDLVRGWSIMFLIRLLVFLSLDQMNIELENVRLQI